VAGGLAVATLVLALVAAGAAYFRLEKRLTLTVDGAPRPVRTFEGTVGELLEASGLALESHDEVQPAPATSLADGMEIDVHLAKEVTLLLNGEARSIWITGGRTVAEVLDLVNLRTDRNAYLEPPPGATVEDGDTIVVREAVSLALHVDGRTRDVITNAARVGEVLDSLGVVLDAKDRVTPGVNNLLEDGMRIRVVRVEIRRRTAEEAIPFPVDVRYSDDMYQGQEKVVQEGESGLRRSVYRVRVEDGRPVSQRVVDSDVVDRPVRQIVVRGTRPPAYQVGEATWYERTGMVAAHKTLPFGTEVTVTDLSDGDRVTVVINDRGPYGAGRIIDLSDDAFARLAPLGAGVIDVRITW
jgi:resuscitation-promoting factor RpfB